MRRLVITAAAAVAIAVSGTAIAFASIPDSSGVIHGCYTVKGGSLRVIDTAKGQTCTIGQHALNWNQKGPRGPAGPAGPPGPAGVSGYAVALCTVAEDGTTGIFSVVSSSGGTCSVTGDYQHPGQALLVCPAGDKAISWSSDSLALSVLSALNAMPNANDTGYRYTVIDNPGNQPRSASTEFAVTCAQVS